MPKKNRKQRNSVSKAANDGRAGNGKGKPNTKEITSKLKSMPPAQLNKAKKDQISTYALKAMKKVFGSEAEAWETLAEQAKDSFAHMNLLWQYRYGKPGDQAKEDNTPKVQAPVINFYANSDQIKELDNTIDIDAIDVDELNDEDDE